LFFSCSDIRDSEGKTPLYRAAETGNLQEVQKLVEAGAGLDSRNTYPEDTPFFLKWLPGTRHLAGLSPLHAAAENQHVDIVTYLIVNGADVNVRDDHARTTLLRVAASHGDMEIVKLLVDGGADVDPVDSRGFTPLIHSAEQGNAALARYLLSKGALAERHTRNGQTALHFAAENGNAEIASALLANGAQVNQTFEKVQPVLQLAVLNGHGDVIEALLEAGADPNLHAPGTTPLLGTAAYEGERRTVELLLEYGADVNRISGGRSAVHYAAEKGYHEILSALILCGADIELTDAETNRTPLQIAVEDNHVETVTALLEAGADPDSEAYPLSPPLIRAARLGYIEIVKLLVLHGADVNIRDGEWTPLRFAEYGNHEEVAEFLREQGGVQ
jgi:ankyrin repeat protein